jgi:hypothetical protein
MSYSFSRDRTAELRGSPSSNVNAGVKIIYVFDKFDCSTMKIDTSFIFFFSYRIIIGKKKTYRISL